MEMEDKAINWIKNYYNRNRKMIHDLPLEAYYKMPLALLLAGEKEFSTSLILEMESSFDIFNYSDEYLQNRRCDNYYKYWLLLFYALSNNYKKDLLFENIKLSFSNEVYGIRSSLSNQEYELRSTSFGGICSFLMEDISLAILTSEFIITLYEQNYKHQDKYFYFKTNDDNELIRVFPDGMERFYVYHSELNNPLTYSFSLAIINLGLANIVTGDSKYLEYAKKYFNILTQNNDRATLKKYAGKFGIASALLYYITKEELYMSYVNRVIKYLKNSQTSAGFWNFSSLYDNSLIGTIDRTSEFSISINIIKTLMTNTSNLNKYYRLVT